jgi:ATP phosphoribosyltransferase regulatory subunit
MIRLDFSVVNDPAYYNGLIFQGYVGGIPERVIAGGQYDLLMRKMGRSSRAVGFAVYLDTLERLEEPGAPDADVLLIYPESAGASTVFRAVRALQAQGLTVSAQKTRPEKRRFARTAILTESGEIEYDA